MRRKRTRSATPCRAARSLPLPKPRKNPTARSSPRQSRTSARACEARQGRSTSRGFLVFSRAASTTLGAHFDVAQPGSELVEHSVHELVAVRATIYFCELYRFIDHHPVRHLELAHEFIAPQQKDPTLDRRELFHAPVEERLHLRLEARRILDRAVQQCL